MITKAYVDYIYNNCFIERMDTPYNTVFLVETPNGFCFSVSAETPDMCISLTRTKIVELEGYLQRDRECYGYDVEGEYE